MSALRAILLFEADFNQNNKRFGRAVMYNAEDLCLLAKEQYGSRKRKSAIDHCLNRRLTFDMARLRKRPLAVCSNDAKACYDRIVHAIASIALQRVGAPKEPIICMFTTLQKLRHHIRTIYGDSEISFSGELWAVPIQGVGQGNGAGPQIWALISTPLLNILRNEGYGVCFKTAMTQEEIKFAGYAFVDDTDLCCSSLDETATPTKVAEDLQKALDIWEGTLHATGGAIGPPKTKWWAISFAWDAGDWSYATIEDSPATLSVRDPHGVQTQLERLPAHQAIRMLGVRLAPDGNNDAEVAYLRSKAKDWAERIRNGHLPNRLAWQSLQSSILRTLQYPLPATTFTKQEATDIMGDLLADGLNSLDICRKFPLDLVHGPRRFQGLQVPHLYTAQGTDHISKIIRFTYDLKSLTGSMIRAQHEQLLVETGLDPPLFNQPFKPWKKALTKCWLSHLWEFLEDSHLKMEDKGPSQTMKRENDKLITQLLVQDGLEGVDLLWVNRCRLWLQVVSLADLTQGHHAQVSDSIWSGAAPCSWNKHIDWPFQEKPPKKHWDLWRRTLDRLLNLTQRCLPESHHLGPWTNLPSNWKWYFDPVNNLLYEQDEAAWFCYKRLPGRSSRRVQMRFPTTGRKQATPPPSHAEPASVSKSGSLLVLSSHAPSVTVTRPTAPSFQALLDTQPPSLAWAYEFGDSWGKAPLIAQALREGRLTSVSDGSFKTRFGTAAWVFETLDKLTNMDGGCIVPGHPSIQSSGRSELAGLYGIAAVVYLLCKHYNITEGAIEVGCDGLNALRDCFTPGFTASCAKPHFDLVCAIRTLIKRTQIKWTWRHVDGHQLEDPFLEYGDLDRWGQLNEDMDLQAKALLHIMNHDRTLQYRIYAEPWTLWVGNEKVSANTPDRIRWATDGPRCIARWNKHHKFGTASSNDVDWDATEDMMDSLPNARARWTTKHSFGMCGVGKWMLRWKKRTTADCPHCGEFEDAVHVWLCHSQAAADQWTTALADLEAWLDKHNTDPALRELLLTGLLAWRNNHLVPTSIKHPILAALQGQLGWQSIFEGRPATGWKEAQQEYYIANGKRQTGRRWLSQLLTQLNNIAFQLWDVRNKTLHSNKCDLAHEVQIQDVLEAFSSSHEHSVADARHFFRHGLQTVLDKQPHLRAAWLYKVQSALKGRTAENSTEELQQRRTLQQQQHSIRRFLGATRHAPQAPQAIRARRVTRPTRQLPTRRYKQRQLPRYSTT